MGADITLNDAEGNEISYFRDSYHDTSLAYFVGYSWWCDIVPLWEGLYLPVENAKKLKQMLLDKPVTPEAVHEISKKLGWSLEREDCLILEGQYLKKWKLLLCMLEKSIETGIPLECSL